MRCEDVGLDMESKKGYSCGYIYTLDKVWKDGVTGPLREGEREVCLEQPCVETKAAKRASPLRNIWKSFE